jgi:peptidyl-prolyl cis-trans isomerase SurA
MKKTILAITMTLAAASLSAAELVEAVVVRVGDRIITRSQYDRRLRDGYMEIEQTAPAAEVAARKQDLQKRIVDELINELLIKDRADRIGITVSDEEINDATTRLKQQYNISTDEQFDASLRQSGLTRTDMQLRLRDTLITNKVFARELRNRSELDDRELRARYEREKERYRLPERAKLREIVIIPAEGANPSSAAEQANALIARVRAGEDFVKIAQEHSMTGTKERGGDMGEVSRGELLPDLDREVFNANAGAVIGPIFTGRAYHILKVEERLPSEVPGFDSVKDRLRRDVGDETFQRDLEAYLKKLREDAFIQINEAAIPKA